jgi:hypothetical protein
MNENMETILYQSRGGDFRLDVGLGNNTVWLDQKQIADLFKVNEQDLTRVISTLYKTGELDKSKTTLLVGDSDFPQIVGGGPIRLFNLDVITAIGYRVNSEEAVRFRKWSAETLKDYLVKGFTIDRERVLSDQRLLSELSHEIRELRMQKMLSYKEIRGVLARASSDYDPHSSSTSQFYSRAHNLLNYGVTGSTASELIFSRSDAKKENCGVVSFAGSVPHSEEVVVAKNYLYPDELDTMHRIVDSLLSVIEWQVRYGLRMTQGYWLSKIEELLKLYGLPVWEGRDTVNRDESHKKAREELKLYKQNLRHMAFSVA